MSFDFIDALCYRVGVDKNIELINLGNKIRETRLKKGMTQLDLASRINKDQQSIQRLEKGKVNPSFIYLMETCEGLEVTLSELLS